MRRLLLIAVVLLAQLSAALAVNPDEMLADPALEARARAISAELRCLVCQNQSIDDSDADLARDLRLIVRERLTAGDTDPEVMRYVVDRYGEYVLLRPVMGTHTVLLWIAAPVLLLVAFFAIFIVLRRRTAAAAPVAELSTEEAEALDRLGDESR